MLLLFTFCLFFITFSNSFPVNQNMQTFASAIKNGHVNSNIELVVYETNQGQSGSVTEQWFTGGVFDENTIVRYYIDGDSQPTIEMNLLLGHGIGFSMVAENNNVPWATKRIGHNAKNGGLFNTFRIPFMKSIKISIQCVTAGTFWYIVRGIYNYQIQLGDLELPASSTKLRLYKNTNVLLTPLQFITLANVSNTAGALYMVTIEANSTDYNYLEACVRVRIDGESKYQFLSSGTEDFFLSAYYFDAGIYHDNDAGATFFNGKGAMSAYKFFEEDPILFTKSLELVWRCGEEQSDANACPISFVNETRNYNKNNLKNVQLANTMVNTYTWVYEFSY